MTASQIIVRRGQTFALLCRYTPAAGALPNLLGAVITSHVRQKGVFVQELRAELALDGLSFTLDGGDTTGWPLEMSDMDVRIEIDGEVYYTNTVAIYVRPVITTTEVP